MNSDKNWSCYQKCYFSNIPKIIQLIFILVRKHDVYKTLNLARKLFAEYLNDDWAISNTSSNNIENIEDIDKASC